MSKKDTSNLANLTNLTGAMCRKPRRVTTQAWMGPRLWLASAAALVLCVTGCSTQDLGNGSLPLAAQPEGPVPAQSANLAITSIAPVEGPTEGGVSVTIEGRGFVAGTTVFFGEAGAKLVKIVNDRLITAVIPPHDEGAVPVSVESPDGIRTFAPQAFDYLSADCVTTISNIDTDGDGLNDTLELCGWKIAVDLYGFGTDNPAGLYYYTVYSNPKKADTDNDGLSDYDEYLIGSDPGSNDTDGDGLKDAEEVYRWQTSPVSVDSDGDANGDNDALPPNASLFDGAELKIDFRGDPIHTPAIDATSPTSEDTDGDGRSDYEELGHPVLSPVIADLPALELQVVDQIDVLLNVEYAEEAGTSTEYGTSFSRATTESQHWYTGGTAQVSMGFSLMVGLEAEAGFPECSATAKTEATVSTEVSYSQEWQVGGEKSEELRNESSRLEAKSRTHTETVSSGAISTGIVLTNTGPVSYRLTDLGMTVRLFERGVNPDDPLYVGSFKTVATLVPTLGENGFTLAPGQSTPVLQVQAQNVNVDRIKDFLRDPHALHLEQAYFEMETEDGLDYGFIEEATQASTATITTDFGDGEWHKYRLATNVNRDANGNPTGVRMADALDLLGIGYQTTMRYADPGHTVPICRVLTHVQKDDGTWLPEELDPNNIDRYAMWTVFGTSDDFEDDTLDFEDVMLRAGDAAMLVFALDADEDGVYGWDEDHYGSSDDPGNADYDGDGLTDDEEVNPQPLDPNDPNSPFVPAGWDVKVGDDPPYRAFSDPSLADGDGDGLTDLEEKLGRDGLPPGDPSDTGDATDPNKKDTDGDGISDFDDAAPTVPARTLRVKPDSPPGGDGATWGTAFPDLQGAILEAKDSNLDDIDPYNDVSEIWVATGNYGLTTAQPLLPHVGIYGGFIGVETKRSQRAGLPTNIDGSGLSFVAFHNEPYEEIAAHGAVLDGLMMTNWSCGTINLCNASENVTLRNMQFIGNGAIPPPEGFWGGAVRIGWGSWTLENCLFANNEASPGGGAIQANDLELVIRDCQFCDNRVVDPGYAPPVEGNWGGGAICVWGNDARVSISRSRFVGNKVEESGVPSTLLGGAIYAGKYPDNQVDKLHLTDCFFSSNALEASTPRSARGGAVCAWQPHDLCVTNCVFHHNYVASVTSPLYSWAETGNGMWADIATADSCTITNCTFVGNVRGASRSAAVYIGGEGLKRIQNLVSAYNDINWPGYDEATASNLCFGTLNNVAIDNICLYPTRSLPGFDDTEIYLTWPTEVLIAEPGLVSIPDPPNGYWGDPHLGDDSILIDAGNQYVDIDPMTPGIQFLPEYGLDGQFRIVDGDGDGVATVDIGAYEYSPY